LGQCPCCLRRLFRVTCCEEVWVWVYGACLRLRGAPCVYIASCVDDVVDASVGARLWGLRGWWAATGLLYRGDKTERWWWEIAEGPLVLRESLAKPPELASCWDAETNYVSLAFAQQKGVRRERMRNDRIGPRDGRRVTPSRSGLSKFDLQSKQSVIHPKS
jgi:hypothetical protein